MNNEMNNELVDLSKNIELWLNFCETSKEFTIEFSINSLYDLLNKIIDLLENEPAYRIALNKLPKLPSFLAALLNSSLISINLNKKVSFDNELSNLVIKCMLFFATTKAIFNEDVKVFASNKTAASRARFWACECLKKHLIQSFPIIATNKSNLSSKWVKNSSEFENITKNVLGLSRDKKNISYSMNYPYYRVLVEECFEKVQDLLFFKNINNDYQNWVKIQQICSMAWIIYEKDVINNQSINIDDFRLEYLKPLIKEICVVASELNLFLIKDFLLVYKNLDNDDLLIPWKSTLWIWSKYPFDIFASRDLELIFQKEKRNRILDALYLEPHLFNALFGIRLRQVLFSRIDDNFDFRFLVFTSNLFNDLRKKYQKENDKNLVDLFPSVLKNIIIVLLDSRSISNENILRDWLQNQNNALVSELWIWICLCFFTSWIEPMIIDSRNTPRNQILYWIFKNKIGKGKEV